MTPRIAELHHYPVKSCAGIALDEAILEPAGIRYDRDWMVVDEAGVFVAQRGGSRSRGIGVRELCHVRPALTPTHLELRAPDMPALRVPLGQGKVATSVRVWSRTLPATDEGSEASQWLTAYLSRFRPGQYRLVRIHRPEANVLGFVDDDALLVQSRASLDDLNSRLLEPVPQNRFRPSIVIEGIEAYEEDRIEEWMASGLTFRGQALCTRCPITMTDQATARQGHEPLRTLAAYRRIPTGVAFGRYFRHDRPGRLRRGDRIEVLTRRRTPVPM